jgi:predicted adenylyl cyclase CyaB
MHVPPVGRVRSGDPADGEKAAEFQCVVLGEGGLGGAGRQVDGREARATCDAILRHLGFDPAAMVRKHRLVATTQRRGFAAEIALDEVDHLGHFVELEVSVDADDPYSAAMESAKQVLTELTEELGLSEVERRSYLELLAAGH